MCMLVDLSSSIFRGFGCVSVREIEKKVQYSAREAVLGCLGKGLDIFFFCNWTGINSEL